jgi:hypothetical protein
MGLMRGFLILSSSARLIPFGNCRLHQSLTTGLWRRYEQKRDNLAPEASGVLCLRKSGKDGPVS